MNQGIIILFGIIKKHVGKEIMVFLLTIFLVSPMVLQKTKNILFEKKI